MRTAKKLLLATALTVALGGYVSTAHAVDNVDVEATVDTRTAINVVKNEDINFGLLDVTIATQAATIVLDPLTDAVTGGTATVVHSGTAQSGRVTITTDGASDIAVTCNATATLVNGDGDSLTVSAVTIEAAVGATLAATACTGAGITVTPTAADVEIGIGGTLALAAGGNEVKAGSFLTADGNQYNSATGAGVPVNILAVYQ